MAQIKYNLGDLGKEKYSTEETAIGTWIDGKTIYRKCIVNNGSFPANSGSGTTLSVDLSNVDRIIEFHGTAIFDSLYELPLHYADSGSHFDSYRDISENKIYIIAIVGNKKATLTKAFIFMDYTKITE